MRERGAAQREEAPRKERGAEQSRRIEGQSRIEEKAAEQSRTAEPRGGWRLVRGDVGDAEACA